MTTLILVRHGITADNLNYTLIGRTDPPLHELGVRQATAVTEELSRTEIRAILTSPLKRCLETAKCITEKHPNLKPRVCHDLAEIDLGIVDGMSSFIAYEHYQSMMDEALNPESADFSFPSGESRSAALYRFKNAIVRIACAFPNETVCVVTHGGIIGLWLAHLHGDVLGRFRFWQPDNASITRVTVQDGHFDVQLHNFTGHLSKELQRRIQTVRDNMFRSL